MSQALPAPLEPGRWPVTRPLGDRLRTFRHKEVRQIIQDGLHVRGIVVPVRRQMQPPSDAQPGGQQTHEIGLNQPALVVPLLVPGIREEDLNPIQAARGYAAFQNLNRIFIENADIAKPAPFNLSKQVPHPGPMHLDTDKVSFRPPLGLRGKALAVPESDLDRYRRNAPEDRCEIDHRVARRNPEVRPEQIQRTPLTRRQTAFTAHEASDPPFPCGRVFQPGIGHRLR